MRRKLLVAPLTLALIAALLSGSTTAWLTARADAPRSELAAGTVLIEAANIDDSKIIAGWEPGDSRHVSYNVTNTGSKCVLLRARYDEEWYERWCETAMVRMSDQSHNFTYQWANHPWFTYVISEPAQSKETFYFYAAQHHRVGEVDVWRDNGYLHIDIRLDPDFEMTESHVNVQLDSDSYRIPGFGGFGNWPHTADHGPAVDSYLYSIPWQSAWDNRELYISVHADVCGDWIPWESPGDVVSVEPCDPSWRMGTDGYLYYVGDGDCLEGVLAGETVELCLRVRLSSGNRDYQDKLLKLLLTFEAVQCSNNAAHKQGWQFTCTGKPPYPAPAGGYFTARAQANAVFRTGFWQQQGEDLLVHTDGVELRSSVYGPDTHLHGMELQNIGQRDITISQVFVSWTTVERRGCRPVGARSSSGDDWSSQGTTPGPVDSAADGSAGNSTAETTEAPAGAGNTTSVAGNSTAGFVRQPQILCVTVSTNASAVLWSGSEPSRTTLDIRDYILGPGEQTPIDFVFDSRMEGKRFAIVFIMNDGSSVEVSVGPVSARGGAIYRDGYYVDGADRGGHDAITDTVGGNATAGQTDPGNDGDTTGIVGGNSTAGQTDPDNDGGTTDTVGGNATADEPGAGEAGPAPDNGDDTASQEHGADEGKGSEGNADGDSGAGQSGAAGDECDSGDTDGDADSEHVAEGDDGSVPDNGDDPASQEPGVDEGEGTAGNGDGDSEVGQSGSAGDECDGGDSDGNTGSEDVAEGEDGSATGSGDDSASGKPGAEEGAGGADCCGGSDAPAGEPGGADDSSKVGHCTGNSTKGKTEPVDDGNTKSSAGDD